MLSLIPSSKSSCSRTRSPKLFDVSVAFRERLVLVPFLRSFTGDAADRQLEDKLLCELPQIAWWALQGARAYLKEGLGVLPQTVTDAVDNYMTEEDVVGEWVSDNLIVGPAKSCPVRWVNDRIKYTGSAKEKTQICARLEEMGAVRQSAMRNSEWGEGSHRWWQGVALCPWPLANVTKLP